jgi:hypothetical protein
MAEWLMDQMVGFDDLQIGMGADDLGNELENEVLCFLSLVCWTCTSEEKKRHH